MRMAGYRSAALPLTIWQSLSNLPRRIGRGDTNSRRWTNDLCWETSCNRRGHRGGLALLLVAGAVLTAVVGCRSGTGPLRANPDRSASVRALLRTSQRRGRTTSNSIPSSLISLKHSGPACGSNRDRGLDRHLRSAPSADTRCRLAGAVGLRPRTPQRLVDASHRHGQVQRQADLSGRPPGPGRCTFPDARRGGCPESEWAQAAASA